MVCRKSSSIEFMLPPKKGLAMQIITSNMLFAENCWQSCLNCQFKGCAVQMQKYSISIKKSPCAKLDWWWHSHTFCNKTKVDRWGKSAPPPPLQLAWLFPMGCLGGDQIRFNFGVKIKYSTLWDNILLTRLLTRPCGRGVISWDFVKAVLKGILSGQIMNC